MVGFILLQTRNVQWYTCIENHCAARDVSAHIRPGCVVVSVTCFCKGMGRSSSGWERGLEGVKQNGVVFLEPMYSVILLVTVLLTEVAYCSLQYYLTH